MSEIDRGATARGIDEKLSSVSFRADSEPHIQLDPAICARCRIQRVCVTVCPAGNYRHDERSGQVILSTESCMECGSCRIACTERSVTWRWPRGGFGVCYSRG